jgi:hypothetical protein
MPYIIDNITANTINVKDTLLINGVPVSGGGGLDDITYSDLYNKTVNGELEPGKWYRLTDYKSVNFLNGWEIANNNPSPTDPNFNPQEIYEGETEVLILQATSPYEISEIGYSEKFQGDIVQYEPFINKIGVDIGGITNGNILPDSATVSGFDLQWDGTNVYFNMPTGYPALFGHYFYLYCEFDGGNYYQDGAFDPLTPGISVCQYPYTSDDPDYGYPKAVSRIRVEDDGMKIVLIDLTEQDYLNYDVDTLYVDTVYALGDAYGWITRRQDTFRDIDVPFDFRGRKYRRFEVDLSVVNPALGTGYWGQGDNYLNQGTTGNFIDVPSFGQDGYDAFTIKWTDMGGPDMYWYRGYNDNNVFLGNLNKTSISSFSYNNTLSSFFYNTVGTDFRGNTVGDNFYYNTVGSEFLNNTVGDSFVFNTVGDSFVFNKINVNFQENMVGINFQSNTVGNNFNNNTVGNNFNNNTVGNGFKRNQIDYTPTSTNFTSATHVYADYTCNIFKRSDNTLQLSYIDGSNVIQYTAVNA